MAIKDITLGQYYPSESVIHRLDPRTKIIGTLVFMVSIFLVKSFTGFAVSAALLAAVIILSKIPFGYIARGLKPVIFIIIITMTMNLLMTPGEPIASFWIITITREGLERSLLLAIRLVLLIFSSSILTLATKPMSLTDGLDSLLSPLRKIGFPAHEITMMMTIAIRFILTLMDETDKIMKAQTARGADFETGSIMQRAKSMIPLLIPLFVSAFRIAADLAMAMEARCYRGGEGRTRMNPMRFSNLDTIAWIILALYLASVIVMRRMGL
ncbi:MAG: energy-coupling factor transporter transmembrane protein EcfT [Firmicutes bacterium]|nr:energy-coupling factor transporter transmembrane protein EcfT [Bacillota bacterium]